MPIGEPWRRRRSGPQRSAGRGFSYLLLLFSLALAGAALAALGSSWQQAAQRSREAELIFRGQQIQDALQRYHDSSPPGQPRLPETLAALLADQRDGPPRHHLRRLWADPFTGRPDWLLLRDTSGRGIVGVRSRARHTALRRHHAPPLAQAAAAGAGRNIPSAGLNDGPNDGPTVSPADRPTDSPPRVGDWLFMITPLPVRGTTPRHLSP